MQPINPHASKLDCHKMLEDNSIYGCASPFRIEGDDEDNITAIPCDYI